MTKAKESLKRLNIKQKLTSYYFKGWISFGLIGSLVVAAIVLVVSRFLNLKTMKELLLAKFSSDIDLNIDVSSLVSSFKIEVFVIVLVWCSLILYFMSWFLWHKKIRLDSLIVYTLLGVFVSTIFFLLFSFPVYSHARAIRISQLCVESCESLEPLIVNASTLMNSSYFHIQTSLLAYCFFVCLSLLQLIIDRVKKIFVLVKVKESELI